MSETSSLRFRKRLENQPDNSAIKQQRLPSIQPVISTSAVRITSLILCTACLAIGGLVIVESNSIQNYDVDYTDCQAYTYFDKSQEEIAHDDLTEFKNHLKVNRNEIKDKNLKCADLWGNWSEPVTVSEPPTCVCLTDIQIEEDITKTSYIYYKLGNFYQNHRRMLRSRDNNQLLALSIESITKPDESCYVNKDRGDQKNDFPCGSLANSMFNDTFFIYDNFPTDEDEILEKIAKPSVSAWQMSGKDIAWKTDVHQKFDADSTVEKSIDKGQYADEIGNEVQVPPNWQYGIEKLGTKEDLFYRSQSDSNGVALKNEDFIVWMRTPAYVNFKKLYRKNPDHVAKGKKKVLIYYNYAVHMFDGSKSIIVGTTSWAGGNNSVLGTIYCVTGSLAFLLFVSTFFVQKK